ncbi:MAG: glycoside hydrolase family 10 protein [Fusobacteriaceae bacterium]
MFKIFFMMILSSILFANTQKIKTVKYKGENIPVVTTFNKRELRAAWIASVLNINWKVKPIEEQKADYIKLLDEIEKMNMNAVIVQIRPTADRFYSLVTDEPWSKYITGEQGKNPGYDPLAFMIEEAHKRNLEFHAWFNPYRITAEKNQKISNSHPAKKNPKWVIKYDEQMYYDPGNPEARKFTQKIISDVVKNYDIDAVHMDDYFYPYPVSKNGKTLPFPDDISYKKSGSKLSKDNWRRENVDTFIKEMSKMIKKTKPYVKFGISPFGVWRNESVDPTGSATKAGHSNYDSLYANTRKWIQLGWIDYITPQIYWDFGLKVAPYGTLSRWWAKEVKDATRTHLYIGQGPYKLGLAGWKQGELENQIKYNRMLPEIKGSMHYGIQNLVDNKENIKNNMKNDVYSKKSLIPVMPWLGGKTPEAPKNIKIIGEKLIWEDSVKNNTKYYAIYKDGELLDTVMRNKKNRFEYKIKNKNARYKVKALDRLHNESK